MAASTNLMLIAVGLERYRQQQLLDAGQIGFDLSDPEQDPFRKYAVVGEEFGEVGRAMLDEGPERLREELIQLAAVSVAWAEALS